MLIITWLQTAPAAAGEERYVPTTSYRFIPDPATFGVLLDLRDWAAGCKVPHRLGQSLSRIERPGEHNWLQLPVCNSQCGWWVFFQRRFHARICNIFPEHRAFCQPEVSRSATPDAHNGSSLEVRVCTSRGGVNLTLPISFSKKNVFKGILVSSHDYLNFQLNLQTLTCGN
jgi:hypothetical protein